MHTQVLRGNAFRNALNFNIRTYLGVTTGIPHGNRSLIVHVLRVRYLTLVRDHAHTCITNMIQECGLLYTMCLHPAVYHIAPYILNTVTYRTVPAAIDTSTHFSW